MVWTRPAWYSWPVSTWMDRHEYKATWYSQGEPPDLSRRAYTVRPDIWPPGFIVDTIPVAPIGHDVPLDLYAAPGAAEALILAGQANVMVPRYNDHRVWVETADPRTKGAP